MAGTVTGGISVIRARETTSQYRWLLRRTLPYTGTELIQCMGSVIASLGIPLTIRFIVLRPAYWEFRN
ncbi:hypothetical protein GCM10017708_16130 [Arthrobacter citreus]